jgi:gliding motility-associated lipoprotein GldH
MNNKIILIFLVISLLTFSCNHVYKNYDKESFPIYNWKAGQEVTFTPVIEDVSKSYIVTLGLRHLYGFQFKTLAVTITSISPSGKQTKKNFVFKIKNAQNEYLAKCAGDYCDLENVVDSAFTFQEPGQYQYIITHKATTSIPGVMELGLIIDKKK